MGLYTQKEYEGGSSVRSHIQLQSVEDEKPADPVEQVEYLILHPENETDNYFNGTIEVDVSGEILKAEFNKGTAIVTDKRVLYALQARGYHLLAERIKRRN